MLDEPHFNAAADAMLTHLFDQMEDAFDNGTFEELELIDGILRIEDTRGNVWIISKHQASRQIWLASPTLGGLHFSFDHASQNWLLPDGRDLKPLLSDDINHCANAYIVL